MIYSRYMLAVLSLAGLLVTYWLYAFAVVPRLLPPQMEQAAWAEGAIDTTTAAVETPAERYAELLGPIFRSDSWERSPDAKVIRTEEFILLLKEYKTLEDGRLHLEPCTLVYLPANESRRTWVLQSAQGAILAFQDGFDLRSGSIGKLDTGYLPGRVLVTGSPSQPGADDRIEIDTRGIQLNQQVISTPQPVSLRYGHSTARGRDLTIWLGAPAGDALRRLPSPSSGPVQRLELVHLDEATLQLPPRALGPATMTTLNSPQTVRLRCEGPFLADLAGRTLRLSRGVSVSSHRPGRPEDLLLCEELTLYLHSPLSAAGTMTDAPPLPALSPERIVAVGQPVVLQTHLPSDVHTTASEPRPWMRHRLEAPRLEYAIGDNGRPGALLAQGAGRYQLGSIDSQSDLVELSWQRQLEFDPQANSWQLAVDGQAHCHWPGLGELAADLLWLQLVPSGGPSLPPPDAGAELAGTSRARPPREANDFSAAASTVAESAGVTNDSFMSVRLERLVADGHVRLRMPLGGLQTDRLDVDIAMDPYRAPAPPVEGIASAGPALSPPAQSGSGAGPRTARDGLARQLEARCRQVQVRAVQTAPQIAAEAFTVDEIVLQGDVEAAGQAPEATQADWQLAGDRLQLISPRRDGGTAVLSGQPARLAASQGRVSGEEIRLNRDENRLWIDGHGEASLPLPGDWSAGGDPAARADIWWQGGLMFDGQTLVCQDRVLAVAPQQRLQTDRLSAKLNAPVPWASLDMPTSGLRPVELHAAGHVELENRTLSAEGWQAIDRLNTEALTLDLEQKTVRGIGPGWVESVRRGAPLGGAPGFTGGAPADPIRQSDPGAADRLIFVHVEFAQGFAGDANRRQIQFGDHIQAVFGPVSDWTQRIPLLEGDDLLPDTATLRCQQLALYQMPGLAGSKGLELMATGNTIVEGRAAEGQQFAARADRLSYDQAKDLLVMQGDGRAKSQLWYQQRQGGPRVTFSADRIKYWPREGRHIAEGADLLDYGE